MGPPEDDEYGMDDEAPETDEMDEVDSKSALLPKGIFDGEIKVGDTITLTVDQVFGDEVEVSVASESPEDETPAGPTADQEIEAASIDMA